MERLTNIECILKTINNAEKDINKLKDIVLRLAEYEDLGMTPEEIEQLKQDYKDGEYEYCGEYGTDDCQFQYRLKELKQEVDYWKREAIKWANELGEQRIGPLIWMDEERIKNERSK